MFKLSSRVCSHDSDEDIELKKTKARRTRDLLHDQADVTDSRRQSHSGVFKCIDLNMSLPSRKSEHEFAFLEKRLTCCSSGAKKAPGSQELLRRAA